MSNQEALSELIQRFAISALSRERKNEALNEEILVGKYTGEFYIKTKDGVVMSADIMNRNKAALDEAIRTAELMCMTGEIYKVDFDNLVLPGHIDYDLNFIQKDEIELPICKEVLLHFDVDEYDIVEDEPKPVHTEGNVKIILEVVVNGNVEYVRADCNLSNVNFTKIKIDRENVTAIKIMNITISKENKVYTAENAERVLLLHNMFISVNN